MDIKTARFICDAVQDAGGECDVYEQYRGRGMSTETTGVVVTSETVVISSLLTYIKENVNSNSEWSGALPNFDAQYFRVDNIGRRIIIY
jgi:hypothetical protein